MSFVLPLRPARAARVLALALACLGAGAAWAQSPLVFAVSEGTSGGGSSVGDEQMAVKYRPVVEVMERVLGQKVAVRYVRDFRQLEDGMKGARFDLVMARPSDYPARGVRDYGYQAVTTTQPAATCTMVQTGRSAADCGWLVAGVQALQ